MPSIFDSTQQGMAQLAQQRAAQPQGSPYQSNLAAQQRQQGLAQMANQQRGAMAPMAGHPLGPTMGLRTPTPLMAPMAGARPMTPAPAQSIFAPARPAQPLQQPAVMSLQRPAPAAQPQPAVMSLQRPAAAPNLGAMAQAQQQGLQQQALAQQSLLSKGSIIPR